MGTTTAYRRVWLAIIILILILNATPRPHAQEPGTILISEIMYNPTEPDSTNEWIELYNPTPDPIDISSWTITDHTETDTIQPDPNHGTGTAILEPDSYAILTDLDTTLYDSLETPETALRLSVNDKTIGNGLGNQYDSLTLTDTDGTVIDSIEYGTDYDDIPGSPAPLIPEGHSLARIPGQDTDDTSTDFTDSDTPTPGTANTEQTTPTEPIDYHVPLVITELYYYTHSRINDEYIAITNPTNNSINLAGWCITDQPDTNFDSQAKIIFPPVSLLPPQSTWILTQNATWYRWETGRLPTCEYEDDSQPDIPQLICKKTMTLSNTGGTVALEAPDGTIIDLVVYGNVTLDLEPCWTGDPVPGIGQGIVMKRLEANGTPVDTNTSLDWIHPRVYQIGQSDFPADPIDSQGPVIAFASPDCSYPVIASVLQNATTSLLLNVYEFTSVPLAEDLLNAIHRNVNISILLDGAPVGGISEEEQAICTVLHAAGAQIRFIETDETKDIHARYRFDHAKYLVRDNSTVVLTSGNWAATGIPTNATYGNREWGVAVTDPALASFFTGVFTEDFNPLRSDSVSLENMSFPSGSGQLPGQFIPIGDYKPGFSPFLASDTCRITPLLSPDTSEEGICCALENATHSIYVEQLEFAVLWDGQESPFLSLLKSKAEEGLDVRIILNADPSFDSTTVDQLKEAINGTSIQLQASPVSPFSTIHNKGLVVDNHTVLVSSVNWNENSVRRNREAAVLIENDGVAQYFASVFLADWYWRPSVKSTAAPWADFKNLILIVVVVTVTAGFIAYDWRRRRW
jgi:cardiolipin synthase A/B